jgi:hypothetical protein
MLGNTDNLLPKVSCQVLPFKTGRPRNHRKPQQIKHFYLVSFIMCMSIKSSIPPQFKKQGSMNTHKAAFTKNVYNWHIMHYTVYLIRLYSLIMRIEI